MIHTYNYIIVNHLNHHVTGYPDGSMLSTWLLLVIIGQCEDGLFTFEKVTGHFLRSAQQVGLAMAASPGITLECGARCLEAGSDCPAFTLDYNSMKCFKLDRNTQGRGSELSPREGQSYFEKICLRGMLHFAGCNIYSFAWMLMAWKLILYGRCWKLIKWVFCACDVG